MVDQRLLTVFRRAFRCELPDANFSVKDVDRWDSLTHIKLVMELESEFGFAIGPDDIRSLYADYDTVKGFIEQHAEIR